LQKAGLMYLRKLDELGEERDERFARYERWNKKLVIC
jgi:hypothetical protein